MPLEINYVKWIVYALIIILLASLLQFFFSIHPPRFKSKITPADYGLKYEDVDFKTKDGLTLKAWFIPSNYSKSAIIIGHGYPFDKGNILQITQFLNKHYNLLLFDFRYFGESQGKYTTAGFKETKDVLAAIDYLKKKEITNIGAIGFSLGGAAILMTKSDDIKAIVADSAYASIDKMIERIYKIFGPLKWPFVWLTKLYSLIFLGINTQKESPVASIKDIKVPILIIHGEKDSQIPVENSKLLYESSNKNKTELWIVANADHGFSYAMDPETYEEKVIGFFDKHLLS